MNYTKRPTCNMVEDCDKPALVVVAGRRVCGEHLIKWNEAKENKIRKEFEGL